MIKVSIDNKKYNKLLKDLSSKKITEEEFNVDIGFGLLKDIGDNEESWKFADYPYKPESINNLNLLDKTSKDYERIRNETYQEFEVQNYLDEKTKVVHKNKQTQHCFELVHKTFKDKPEFHEIYMKKMEDFNYMMKHCA